MLRWEDQELNHEIPENRFLEVFYAGVSLPMRAAKQQGKFLRIDQINLDEMIATGNLTAKAKGSKIDRLCLYFRLLCRIGAGGENYSPIGVTHFYVDGKSLYAILYFSTKNDWLDIMVVSGEAPSR